MKLFDFLGKNLTALQAVNSPALAWLQEHEESLTSLEPDVQKNAGGYIDLKREDGSFLYKNVQPAVFYQGWKQEKFAYRNGTALVGSGLGYGLNHILSTTPPMHKVLLVEPHPEMLGACLALTDYRQFISSGRLLIAPPDRLAINACLAQLNMQYLFGKIQMRLDPPANQIGPEYKETVQLLHGLMENAAVEYYTLYTRQNDMVGNEINNFHKSFADGSVSSLKDAAQDLDAIILGAGPSLADMVPQLKKYPQNVLYASSLQTLPALQALDLKPHLCLVIDYSAAMGAVLDRLDKDWVADIPLVYSTKAHENTTKFYPGPTLPLWTLGGLSSFLMRDSETVFDAGCNVSVTLLRFLSWCGVKNFTLIGQELAWKEGQSHVKGHHAAERNNTKKIHGSFLVKNKQGEPVFTTKPYLAAKREMEGDIEKLGITVHNLYTGGLDIAGTKIATIDDLCTGGLLNGSQEKIACFLDQIKKAQTPQKPLVFEPRAHLWAVSIKNAEKRLRKLLKKAERNYDEIVNLLNNLVTFLRQDPLYMPYLYVEIMQMTELATLRKRYTPAAMKEFLEIKKRVLKKIKHMDSILSVPPPRHQGYKKMRIKQNPVPTQTTQALQIQ